MTIISAVHNAGPLLDRFLDQLEVTVDQHTEIIIVDDHSLDGTAERLVSWRAGRPGITVVSQPKNVGVAACRNLAVGLARGEFIWFVDHDDVWDADITRVLYASATPQDDVVICRAEYRVDPTRPGRIVDGLNTWLRIGGTEAVWMMLDGSFHGFLWSKLIRRSCLASDPFPLMSSQSDVAGLAPTIARARSVVFIRDVLYFYVNRPGSITRRKQPNLDNIRDAYSAVVTAAKPSFDTHGSQSSLDYFTCWFYCKALVTTPTRQHASLTLRLDGVRRARAGLGRVRLARVRPYSRALWCLMMMVRHMPAFVLPMVSVLYCGLDTRRLIQVRFRR